jgi:glycine cleavage system H protein
MAIPSSLRYTDSHKWVRLEGDGTATVGITDHGQEALGDLVQLELPAVGTPIVAGNPVATIESVKGASDVHAPGSGEIIEINPDVVASPDTVNGAPYESWLFRIKLKAGSTLAALINAQEYGKNIGS